jgi:hypothetical protein
VIEPAIPVVQFLGVVSCDSWYYWYYVVLVQVLVVILVLLLGHWMLLELLACGQYINSSSVLVLLIVLKLY